MSKRAIIIGGGHNGLVAAAYLAKAGCQTVVLERRDTLGGLSSSIEFHKGYRVPGVLHDTTLLRASVVSQLGLAHHGLELRGAEVPVLHVGEGEESLLLHRDAETSRGEIAKHSPEDSERYLPWRESLSRLAKFLGPLQDDAAPDLHARRWVELWDLAKRGLSLRRLGERDMLELMRLAPMTLADWLDENFTSSLLKAALAAPTLQGTWLGPRSAGTVLQLLLNESVRGMEVRGGPAALIRALESLCQKLRVTCRTGTEVSRIRIRNGGIQGVELEGGESLDADLVIATCEPKQTFLELIHPRDLPLELESQLLHWRTRGTTAKVHLALEAPLTWKARPTSSFEWVRTGSSLNALEQAFDAIKYRQWSKSPTLEVWTPSLEARDLAPSGHHVASVLVHFVPHELEGGWDDAKRAKLGEAVLASLREKTLNLDNALVAHHVLTPADLAEDYALTGGHIHHGEHALDQWLTMRPNPSCAHHTTPIRGLCLAGSGSHPGGGITGAPGRFGAQAALASQS